jgi:hypothetical protein
MSTSPGRSCVEPSLTWTGCASGSSWTSSWRRSDRFVLKNSCGSGILAESGSGSEGGISFKYFQQDQLITLKCQVLFKNVVIFLVGKVIFLVGKNTLSEPDDQDFHPELKLYPGSEVNSSGYTALLILSSFNPRF